MEGRSDQENLRQLLSLNISGNGNGVSYESEDDPNHHSLMEAGRIINQPNALPLPSWTHFPKAPRNYVEFLADNSTFLESATGADMLETITSPICSIQSPFLSVDALKQNHSSLTQEPNEDNWNVSQLHPRVTITPSFCQSKRRSSGSRQRASAVDHDRRVQIAE
ncbi:hypothetical protein Pint_02339 [Pistacia integerrima]|uniref:Uncharacterized protein n=1 Tax=Pistacia integerrima TaxID=434235 RepID=A0ACC0ZJU4_9ROSI|nr:hypothetical protein Pint_02339 [Pistacia integerrima]